jgi:hypothetical protein
MPFQLQKLHGIEWNGKIIWRMGTKHRDYEIIRTAAISYKTYTNNRKKCVLIFPFLDTTREDKIS